MKTGDLDEIIWNALDDHPGLVLYELGDEIGVLHEESGRRWEVYIDEAR